jgi:KRAB domain-containing zinc finger protein
MFESVEAIQQHLEIDHAQIKCPHCTWNFASQDRLDEHIAKNHQQSAGSAATIASPPVKQVTFKKIKKLVKSLEPKPKYVVTITPPVPRPKQIRPYLLIPCTCDFCGKTMANKRTLQSHIITVHTNERPFKCNLCPKSFPFQFLLKDHLLKHSDNRKFGCEHCGARFYKNSKLTAHINRAHLRVRNFLCTMCGDKFLCSKQLKDHAEVHNIGKPYSCPHEDCMYASKTKNSMTSHLASVHSTKQIPCEVCGKIFKTRNSVVIHMKNMHEDKSKKEKYPCHMCDKSFYVKGLLNDHLKAHENARRYECDTCKKRFNTLYGLRTHIKSHFGLKPFSCDLCGKKFATKLGCTGHINTHTGEMPFLCTYCPKRFRHAGSLLRHLRSHRVPEPDDDQC